jgi:hypothetical protein
VRDALIIKRVLLDIANVYGAKHDVKMWISRQLKWAAEDDSTVSRRCRHSSATQQRRDGANCTSSCSYGLEPSFSPSPCIVMRSLERGS